MSKIESFLSLFSTRRGAEYRYIPKRRRGNSKIKRTGRGPRPRQVASPLFKGCKVDASKKGGYPSGRRPIGYDHGPSEKALKRARKREEAK